MISKHASTAHETKQLTLAMYLNLSSRAFVCQEQLIWQIIRNKCTVLKISNLCQVLALRKFLFRSIGA